ncbi:winged helix-turn-helix transcriptional regulator [Xanthobacter sp. KR7-65]|uniref:winged helix-turn-helix transcriptional regulator n=1 Tax=Xanthobacter sp. KR7-65 TaxID=3156612 RepID=UPI0032B4C5BD
MLSPPVRRSIVMSADGAEGAVAESPSEIWKIKAILALTHAPLTFREVQRSFGRFVPPGRLLGTLLELERGYMVRRERLSGGAAHLAYALTELGRDMAGLILVAQRALDEAERMDDRHRLPFPENEEASLAALAFKGWR